MKLLIGRRWMAAALVWATVQGCGTPLPEEEVQDSADVAVDAVTGQSALTRVEAEESTRVQLRPVLEPEREGELTLQAHDVEVLDPALERAPRLAIAPSCNAAHLTFTSFPVVGVNGRDWLINNYADLDGSAGNTRDFLGFTNSLARTYDGHNGCDIDIPSFREMDDNSAVVRAAAPGVVTFIREDQPDRNMISLSGCTATWNVVRVEHANGFSTLYGHLKRNSVTVNVGDQVQAGTKLGVAGSSGCSTQAHLHFELRDCDNARIESFNSMWSLPPSYSPASDVMDVVLRSGAAPTVTQIKDPAPNVALVKPGSVLGIGLSLGGRQGTKVDFDLVGPGGTDSWSWTQGGNARYRHSFPAWSRVVGSAPGNYSLRVYVNGSLRATRSFKVSSYTPGFAEVAKHGVHESSYQTVFTDIISAGYRPVWVDGYDVNGTTYFNALFRPADGTAWVARHDRTAAQYQSDFNTWTGAGYRPLQVDSYLNGGTRYAVIFVKQAGPAYTAYHGRSAADHQALFNALTAQGYRAKNVSVVAPGGVRSYTALYELTNVGSYVVNSFLTPAQYQNAFNANHAAGRTLRYLNAYSYNGGVRFTAIWTGQSYNGFVARHHETSPGYQAEWQTWTGLGFRTQFVTGYSNGGVANFGALWSK